MSKDPKIGKKGPVIKKKQENPYPYIYTAIVVEKYKLVTPSKSMLLLPGMVLRVTSETSDCMIGYLLSTFGNTDIVIERQYVKKIEIPQ